MWPIDCSTLCDCRRNGHQQSAVCDIVVVVLLGYRYTHHLVIDQSHVMD